jgi:hypothetical protein
MEQIAMITHLENGMVGHAEPATGIIACVPTDNSMWFEVCGTRYYATLWDRHPLTVRLYMWTGYEFDQLDILHPRRWTAEAVWQAWMDNCTKLRAWR